MPGPPLFPPRVGSRLPTGRAALGAVVQAAAGQLGRPADVTGAPGAGAQGATVDAPQTLILVRNDTGADLPAFAVLKLGAPLLDAAADPHALRRTPACPGAAPGDYLDAFAVTIEPAGAGATVRAAGLGYVPCDVFVADEADRWARPGPANGFGGGSTAALLSSSEGGPAKIVWKPAGAGLKRCWVLLQGDMGAAAEGSGAGPCEDYTVVCEQGYLRLYRCDEQGGYTEYVGDLNVPCASPPPPPPPPPRPPPPPSPAHGRPPPPPSPVQVGAPLVFDAVSRVCPVRGVVVTVSADTLLSFAAHEGNVVHANAFAAPILLTLPDPTGEVSARPITIKKVDASANAVTVVCLTGGVEFGASVALDAQGEWHTFYTDGTDWFIGNAFPITGVTQEVRRVVVRAPGAVGAPECVRDPDDCCPDETAVRGAAPCCPDEDLLRLLAFIVTAPAGLGGDEVTWADDLIPLPPGAWGTDGDVPGTNGLGAADALLSGELYCDPALGVWYFEGEITTASGARHQFRVELTADGIDLLGTAAVPGLGDVRVAVVAPCPVATLTECVAVDAVVFGCGRISAGYKVFDESGVEVATVGLLADGSPRFRSPDSTWELRRVDAAIDYWSLEHLDGRQWTVPASEFDCCDPAVPMQSTLPQGPAYEVRPVYDCCDDGSGSGPPPVNTACCNESVSSGLTATVTAATGTCVTYLGRTGPLAFNGTAWTNLPAPSGGMPDLTMSCVSGQFVMNSQACAQVGNTFAPSQGGPCAPFDQSFTITPNPANPNACCSGSFTVRVTG